MPFDPLTGWSPRTAAEILAESQRTFELDFNEGQPLDWDGRDKPEGNLLAANALDRAENEQGILKFVVDGLDPHNATGFMVDNHLALLGERRLEGTYSKTNVTISAPLGTSIPVDTVLRDNQDPRRLWYVDEDYVTTSNPEAIRVRCAVKGPEVVLPGQIVTFVTSIPGATILSNDANTSLGTNEESDDEAKARRARILRGNGRRTLGAIENSVLLSSDEVTSVYVVENDTAITQTIEGVTLSSHSIAVIVYPDTISAEARAAVAEAIYTSKAVSVGTEGAESETLAAVSGVKTVKFAFPSAVTVNAVVTGAATATTTRTDAAIITDIETALVAYFGSLRPGQDVRFLDVQCILASIDGLQSATLTLNGGSADITVSASQIAELGTNTVTIP